MERLTMPARINLAAPEGLLARVHAAAKSEDMSSAEFMREAIRNRVREVESGKDSHDG